MVCNPEHVYMGKYQRQYNTRENHMYFMLCVFFLSADLSKGEPIPKNLCHLSVRGDKFCAEGYIPEYYNASMLQCRTSNYLRLVKYTKILLILVRKRYGEKSLQ